MSWTTVRHLARAVVWQPVAVASSCSLVWLAADPSLSNAPITVITAVVAASTAYLIDDPASVTLASSPTTLRRRRGQRMAAALVAVGVWWAFAVAVIALRSVDVPVASHSLRLAAFVAIALATSSWADRLAHDGEAGIAGAVAVLAAFGSSQLPARWLQLIPLDPVDAAARRHLVLTAAIALALFAEASDDPARRRVWARRAPAPRGVWDGDDQAKTSTDSS